MLKTKYTSLINARNIITLLIDWLNAIYYDSVVIKVITVCNLLHHNNGHPKYVITYLVCDMTYSALSKFALADPTEKSACTQHSMHFSISSL